MTAVISTTPAPRRSPRTDRRSRPTTGCVPPPRLWGAGRAGRWQRTPCTRGQSHGSVSTRASKYSLCSRTCGDVSSCGLQDGQHGRSPPEVEQSLAVGGNVLVVAGAEAEKVAEFVVSATEPGC